MVIANVNKPNNCKFCIFWSKCKAYKESLGRNSKPMCEGCKIVADLTNVTNRDIINTLFPSTDFVTDVFGGFDFPEWWLNEPYKTTEGE